MTRSSIASMLVALLPCINGAVVARPRAHRHSDALHSLTALRGGQGPLPEGAEHADALRSLTALRGGFLEDPLPEGAEEAFPAETLANRADPDDASSGDDDLIQQVYDEVELEEAIEAAGAKLVIIDFFAPWCKPCKQIAPVLEELARKAKGRVVFLKVDTDESQELAQARKIKSMPTFHLHQNGKKLETIKGANEFLLRQRVARALKHPLLRAAASPLVALPLLLGYLVVSLSVRT